MITELTYFMPFAVAAFMQPILGTTWTGLFIAVAMIAILSFAGTNKPKH